MKIHILVSLIIWAVFLILYLDITSPERKKEKIRKEKFETLKEMWMLCSSSMADEYSKGNEDPEILQKLSEIYKKIIQFMEKFKKNELEVKELIELKNKLYDTVKYK